VAAVAELAPGLLEVNMALNIPMPDSPGDSLIKGLNTGSDLMHKLMLNKYYGQLHPSGDVANAMYVEQLRNKYGENDPRYIEAKRAHNLALQGRESLIGYRDTLNQTAGIRATSPLGKEIAEGKGHGAQDILNNRRDGGAGGGDSSGYSYDANGNNIIASPEEIANATNGSQADNNPRTAEERAAYERAINKKTSDSQARNTLLRAENLDKTRQSIDPNDLTRYSGLKGTANYLYESTQAARGNPSPEYLANQKAANSVTLMADQMRQFYGDSIQPSAMDRLRHLANPSTWWKDPKVAKAQWEQLNKILDTETETYRNHASSPITLNKIDFKDGQFKATKSPQSAAPKNSNEGGSFDINAVIPQLLKIDPRYTEENIRSTAKETGKSVDQVINELFQRSVRRQ
jgi:hypothetical protein